MHSIWESSLFQENYEGENTNIYPLYPIFPCFSIINLPFNPVSVSFSVFRTSLIPNVTSKNLFTRHEEFPNVKSNDSEVTLIAHCFTFMEHWKRRNEDHRFIHTSGFNLFGSRGIPTRTFVHRQGKKTAWGPNRWHSRLFRNHTWNAMIMSGQNAGGEVLNLSSTSDAKVSFWSKEEKLKSLWAQLGGNVTRRIMREGLDIRSWDVSRLRPSRIFFLDRVDSR